MFKEVSFFISEKEKNMENFAALLVVSLVMYCVFFFFTNRMGWVSFNSKLSELYLAKDV